VYSEIRTHFKLAKHLEKIHLKLVNHLKIKKHLNIYDVWCLSIKNELFLKVSKYFSGFELSVKNA
jgi:hypothetical protein